MTEQSDREFVKGLVVSRKGVPIVALLYGDLTKEFEVDVYKFGTSGFAKVENVFSTVRLKSESDFEREVNIQLKNGL